MSIHKKSEGVFEVRWREGGRQKSLRVHGSHELARKIERKKMSIRDENRHLDVKREINLRMSALIDRYWKQYGIKKRSADREKSILEGIRSELGKTFVREVDGNAKVIIVTADVQSSTRSLAQEGGASGFVIKPVRAESLLEAVQKALQGGESCS